MASCKPFASPTDTNVSRASRQPSGKTAPRFQGINAVWFLAAAAFLLSCAVLSGAQGQSERPQVMARGRSMSLGGLFEGEYSLVLRNSWFLQSSAKLKEGGEKISQPGLQLEKWFPATVPSTVLGVLVQNDVYRDIFFSDNFKNIPEDDFCTSWWYRAEFLLSGGPGRSHVKLEFDGINYRANIWLNGKKVADAAVTEGAFRRHEIDVTGVAKPGEQNILAVEVFPPKPGEPSIGFVDWNPAPPDRSMGIWREVRVRVTGEVSINHPFVRSKVNLDTLADAELIISAELRNESGNKVTGDVECRFERTQISQKVALEPKETKTIVFTPESHPELLLKNPRLWWTHDLGKPEMYGLVLLFKAERKPGEKPMEKPAEKPAEKPGEKPGEKPAGKQPRMPMEMFSDIRAVRFGIRDVSDYLTEEGYRGYKLNGKKILIRGGGWVDDILLENRMKKLRAEVYYARHMNLNALRLEGFWGTSENLYNLCDENGILLMAGWSCHWEWPNYFGKETDEFGGIKSPEDIKLIAASWRDHIRWLRNHPSILVWLMGSDLLPRPDLEREFAKVLAEDDPTRPFLISAAARTSTISGKSGVKMNGPYDYVPPNYWYVDTTRGGAFGFNTETGPGPQVPPIESVKRMIPADRLWPINEIWNFHASRGRFQNMERYNEAMAKRLGEAKDAEDYCVKAQFLNYEGMRAMFEAFVAGRPKATGIIQWMYNSAWPKLWWQLFDYFLMPTGAFYGAKKAGEPVHLIYHYGTREIIAASLSPDPADKLKASIKVYNLDMKVKLAEEAVISLQPGESKTVFQLPEIEGLSTAYFLDLRLFDKKNQFIASNFYALSTKPDVLDEEKSDWFVTPLKEFADFTPLAGLPRVPLKVKSKFSRKGESQIASVTLENPTPSLAFMVELRVVKDDTGESVLPIFWEDNYISLLPGEKRTIEGSFYTEDLTGSQPEIRAGGWNIKQP